MALTAVGLALAIAVPAAAFSGFTGTQEQNWYIPKNGNKCLYTGGNGEINGCTIHTFTFVSSNDCCGAAFTCAILWNRYDHGAYDSHCNYNIARHCMPGHGDALQCADQDYTTNHAGANNGSAGTTFKIRGKY